MTYIVGCEMQYPQKEVQENLGQASVMRTEKYLHLLLQI
jgi:hypothetical protein